MSSLTARLQILAAAVLFSTGGAAVKACSLSGWQVASFRSGLAAVALALALREGRRGFGPPTLLVGGVYAATLVLYVTANKLTTAANTIFLQSTAPLYVMLLGPLLLRERLRRSDLPFAAAFAAGMTLFFVGVEQPRATAPDPVRGDVLAAFAGFTWGCTLLGLRWLDRTSRPSGASAASAVVAGNVLACVACLPAALPVRSASAADWAVVGYLGLFQIGLAYVFVTRAVGSLRSLEVALLLLLEPVLNAMWAWWIHDERPGSGSIAGAAIVLAATLAFTLRGRRSGSPSGPGTRHER